MHHMINFLLFSSDPSSLNLSRTEILLKIYTALGFLDLSGTKVKFYEWNEQMRWEWDQKRTGHQCIARPTRCFKTLLRRSDACSDMRQRTQTSVISLVFLFICVRCFNPFDEGQYDINWGGPVSLREGQVTTVSWHDKCSLL